MLCPSLVFRHFKEYKTYQHDPCLAKSDLAEDPDGCQSENQRYVETQDLREHTVFTQQHGQYFDSYKQNQLFVSTQQTASSLEVVHPSENALTPTTPSVLSNCSKFQIEWYFIPNVVIVIAQENVSVNTYIYIHII